MNTIKSYEKYISKADIKKIHENSLRVLEVTGISFENERVLEIFKGAGAAVEGTNVRMPSKMVEDALNMVPSSFRLHSPLRGDMVLGQKSKDKITKSISSNIYIEENGRIRKMNNEDNIRQFKMGEASTICTVSHLNEFPDRSMFTKEQKILGIPAMYLRYSKKSLFATNLNAYTCGLCTEEADQYRLKALEMNERFQGITEKNQPINMVLVNILSPLAYDHDSLDSLIFAIEHNLPVCIAPCAMPILTVPSSVAGLMTTTNAEVLAGLVLTQLIQQGSAFMYGNVSGLMDMRKIQLAMGGPETALIIYTTAGLADLYKVPFRAGGSLCDSKDMDAQAGVESMMNLYATMDVDCSCIMHVAGAMGTYNVASLEKFILDEEITAYIKRLLKGVRVDDETLRFDEIRKVGPRGNYLYGKTPQVYREEFYLSRLFNREDAYTWQHTGAKSIKEAAHEEVERRLASYTEPELSREQLDIVAEYLPPMYREHI